MSRPAVRPAWLAWIAAGLCVIATCAGGAARACKIRSITMVPVLLRAGHALLAMRIDHRQAWFILDTGAERSLLTPGAVRRLKLKLDPWVGTTSVGIGGSERHANALVPRLTLGGMKLRQTFRLPEISFSVGAIPGARGTGVRVDGLLGRDVLARYDLDLQFGQGRVTLYRVHGCAGHFLPWWGQYRGTATLPGYRAMLGIPARVDGVTLRAMIDTGASGEMLSAAGMARLGLTVAGLAGAPEVRARGVGPRVVVARFLHLHRMSVAHVTEREVPAVAAPVILTPLLDLLIGMNWLVRHRVWLSYATGQVFVATR